jgi:hypothetical protein
MMNENGLFFTVTVSVALLVIGMGAAASTVAAQDPATIESDSVTISNAGGTGSSAITVDADSGVSIANVEVSVDTSVAEITDVQPGADVDTSNNAVTFNVVDQTADSVRIEYNNIAASGGSVNDFEVAVVEFEATGGGSAPIALSEDGVFDSNSNQYGSIGEQEGTITVGVSGGLSPNNPFGDSNDNPVDRGTVINRVVEWNLNGEIGGTSYTRQEIIDFVVEWNLES